jgi:pSer/pThr/pTyr-binding forkhead associated (FHA) protein
MQAVQSRAACLPEKVGVCPFAESWNMPKLVCRKGRNEGDEFPVGEGTVGIGRSNVCNVVLFDGRCSRLHCNIHKRGREYYLEDLGSSNGTFLNGKKMTRGELVELRIGGRIRLGDSDLEFCRGDADVQPKKKGAKKKEEDEVSQTLSGSNQQTVLMRNSPTFWEKVRRWFGR